MSRKPGEPPGENKVFDANIPPNAPDVGAELSPQKTALSHYHNQTRHHSRFARDHKLEDDTSPLYGIRGITYPLSAALLSQKYGNVRAAMAQQLAADFKMVHEPFVDPSRPEGVTHIVDDPDPEQILSAFNNDDLPPDRKRFEWRSNLY